MVFERQQLRLTLVALYRSPTLSKAEFQCTPAWWACAAADCRQRWNWTCVDCPRLQRRRMSYVTFYCTTVGPCQSVHHQDHPRRWGNTWSRLLDWPQWLHINRRCSVSLVWAQHCHRLYIYLCWPTSSCLQATRLKDNSICTTGISHRHSEYLYKTSSNTTDTQHRHLQHHVCIPSHHCQAVEISTCFIRTAEL